MKKVLSLMLTLVLAFVIVGCDNSDDTTTTVAPATTTTTVAPATTTTTTTTARPRTTTTTTEEEVVADLSWRTPTFISKKILFGSDFNVMEGLVLEADVEDAGIIAANEYVTVVGAPAVDNTNPAATCTVTNGKLDTSKAGKCTLMYTADYFGNTVTPMVRNIEIREDIAVGENLLASFPVAPAVDAAAVAADSTANKGWGLNYNDGGMGSTVSEEIGEDTYTKITVAAGGFASNPERVRYQSGFAMGAPAIYLPGATMTLSTGTTYKVSFMAKSTDTTNQMRVQVGKLFPADPWYAASDAVDSREFTLTGDAKQYIYYFTSNGNANTEVSILFGCGRMASGSDVWIGDVSVAQVNGVIDFSSPELTAPKLIFFDQFEAEEEFAISNFFSFADDSDIIKETYTIEKKDSEGEWVEIDEADVATNALGEYQIRAFARDDWWNETEKTVTFKIMPRPEVPSGEMFNIETGAVSIVEGAKVAAVAAAKNSLGDVIFTGWAGEGATSTAAAEENNLIVYTLSGEPNQTWSNQAFVMFTAPVRGEYTVSVVITAPAAGVVNVSGDTYGVPSEVAIPAQDLTFTAETLTQTYTQKVNMVTGQFLNIQFCFGGVGASKLTGEFEFTPSVRYTNAYFFEDGAVDIAEGAKGVAVAAVKGENGIATFTGWAGEGATSTASSADGVVTFTTSGDRRQTWANQAFVMFSAATTGYYKVNVVVTAPAADTMSVSGDPYGNVSDVGIAPSTLTFTAENLTQTYENELSVTAGQFVNIQFIFGTTQTVMDDPATPDVNESVYVGINGDYTFTVTITYSPTATVVIPEA